MTNWIDYLISHEYRSICFIFRTNKMTHTTQLQQISRRLLYIAFISTLPFGVSFWCSKSQKSWIKNVILLQIAQLAPLTRFMFSWTYPYPAFFTNVGSNAFSSITPYLLLTLSEEVHFKIVYVVKLILLKLRFATPCSWCYVVSWWRQKLDQLHL